MREIFISAHSQGVQSHLEMEYLQHKAHKASLWAHFPVNNQPDRITLKAYWLDLSNWPYLVIRNLYWDTFLHIQYSVPMRNIQYSIHCAITLFKGISSDLYANLYGKWNYIAPNRVVLTRIDNSITVRIEQSEWQRSKLLCIFRAIEMFHYRMQRRLSLQCNWLGCPFITGTLISVMSMSIVAIFDYTKWIGFVRWFWSWCMSSGVCAGMQWSKHTVALPLVGSIISWNDRFFCYALIYVDQVCNFHCERWSILRVQVRFVTLTQQGLYDHFH